MKILMLGWEFPPIISGGLGIASRGIAESLAAQGHVVDFLLPFKDPLHQSDKIHLIDASMVELDEGLWHTQKIAQHTLRATRIGLSILPYLPAEIFLIDSKKQLPTGQVDMKYESTLLKEIALTGKYTTTLHSEISKYALIAVQVALANKYDAVHAHDWVTFRAGRMVSEALSIPLYAHCHSTEYDRNGQHAQRFTTLEEQQGFDKAKAIFCVSTQLKHTISTKYHITPEKLFTVPNAHETSITLNKRKKKKEKNILFIGRFTNQKNPLKFIDIARDLINKGIHAKFTMIGDGYLKKELKAKAAVLNLSAKINFPGFLDHKEVLSELQNADLLIVPSRSEPFGIVILEAIHLEVPVVSSLGVGAGEYIRSLPQVEEWDHFNFVKKCEMLLLDHKLAKTTMKNCLSEASELSWEKSAELIEQIYRS